jgi:hypothetical protein
VSVCGLKETTTRLEAAHRMEIFPSYASDKGLITRITGSSNKQTKNSQRINDPMKK